MSKIIDWEKNATCFTAYLLAKVRAAGVAAAEDEMAAAAGAVLVLFRGNLVPVSRLVEQAAKHQHHVGIPEAWCWALRQRLDDIAAQTHPLVADALLCHARGLADVDVSWDQVQAALAQEEAMLV